MKKLLLLLVLASVAAYAVDYEISEGSVSITSGGKYTVTGSTTENSIDIDTADDVEITLDNVSITDVESSFRINRGNVTLILVGSNTLDVWDAGIYVGASAALTISAESTGSLTIENFTDTGIGGRDRGTAGTVIINGGSVKASSEYGSPIGPGKGAGLCPTPLNWDHGEAIYKAVLEGAMADTLLSIFGTGDGIVSFTATRIADGLTYSYEGEGHSGTDDLYFYLPEGDYTIAGSNGKTYAGSVSSSGSTIVPTPEPALIGLLAVFAFCFRRR